MSKNIVLRSVIAVVLLFTMIGFAFSIPPMAKAAPPVWMVYSGNVTLGNPIMGKQQYVVDASVLKVDAVYKMWYTHGELDINSSISAVKTLDLSNIIDDLTNMDIDALLDDFSDLDAATLYALLNETNAAIGYATSNNGTSWVVVDPAVLGGSGDTYKKVGTPSVTFNGTGYEMWFTNLTTDLTQVKIQSIQAGLAGDAAARRTAIMDLVYSISMSIGYATSPDGINWTVVNPSTLSGSGSLLDSYCSPSIINDGGTYKMWYTHFKTGLTGTNLDAILADINNFDTTDLWDILNSVTAVLGYATSPDGITWTVVNPQILPAVSGGIFNSVSSPSVIKNPDNSFEMWYTSTESDLTSVSLSNLYSAIASIDFASLWNSLQTLDLNGFFNALLQLDISGIKNILSGTSSSVGYATSADGINWIVQNAKLVTGTGGFSAGISAPTVIKTPIAYEMWYTQGIPDITLQNIVSLLDGTILPLGYASLTTGATVEISVVLQGPGRPDAGWIVPINIKFCTPGTSDVIYNSDQVTVKSGGFATANVTGVAPGSYDIYVVSVHTLINVKRNVTISSPTTQVNLGTLLEGNANNDNQVTLADFNLLKANFGTSNPVADFDRSGQITLADFNLLKANFGKASPREISQ